jgi:hypothetical protein
LHYICLGDFDESDRIPLLALLHLLDSSENIQNVRGNTPLHHTMMGHANPIIASFLITHCNSVHTINQDGNSPLDFNVPNNLSEKIEMLHTVLQKKKFNHETSIFELMQQWAILSTSILNFELQSIQHQSNVHNDMTSFTKLDGLFGGTSVDLFCKDYEFRKQNIEINISRDLLLYKLNLNLEIIFSPLDWWPSQLNSTRVFLVHDFSHNNFLDILTYPGWSDNVIRAVLLFHSKYINTIDLLDILVNESPKLVYLYRVLALWFSDSHITFCNIFENCDILLKQLFSNLASVAASPVISLCYLEKLKECLEYVRVFFNEFLYFNFLFSLLPPLIYYPFFPFFSLLS